MRRFLKALPLAVLFAALPLAAKADLAGYLAQPDSSYSWKPVLEKDLGVAHFHEFHLKSQTWQEIPWEHNIYLFIPKRKSDAKPGSALLLIEGGSQKALRKAPASNHLLYGAMLAEKLGVPCAVLRQVPNQPLYDGLKEDWLVARTFENYLDTGDETWPLLFPMTKAAIRAMDAIGDFSAAKLGTRLDRFMVMGASKRGWTTWLTAASDQRVTAIAPLVIDMLNTREQARHQKETLGDWSEQTRPYHPILKREPTERIEKLWSMVDPYTYRERVTQPKLLILGNNDPFWSTDSLNLYWDDLSSPKWVHYVPNAGHNLSPIGEKKKLPFDLINHLAAFVRSHFSTDPEAAPLPELTWQAATGEDGTLSMTVKSSTPPAAAKLWSATGPNRDFREAIWKESAALITRGEKGGPSTITASLPPPAEGALAYYLTMEYDIGGLPFKLSTQLRIVEAPQGKELRADPRTTVTPPIKE